MRIRTFVGLVALLLAPSLAWGQVVIPGTGGATTVPVTSGLHWFAPLVVIPVTLLVPVHSPGTTLVLWPAGGATRQQLVEALKALPQSDQKAILDWLQDQIAAQKGVKERERRRTAPAPRTNLTPVPGVPRAPRQSLVPAPGL